MKTRNSCDKVLADIQFLEVYELSIRQGLDSGYLVMALIMSTKILRLRILSLGQTHVSSPFKDLTLFCAKLIVIY